MLALPYIHEHKLRFLDARPDVVLAWKQEFEPGREHTAAGWPGVIYIRLRAALDPTAWSALGLPVAPVMPTRTHEAAAIQAWDAAAKDYRRFRRP
jgi:hypothetical protein